MFISPAHPTTYIRSPVYGADGIIGSSLRVVRGRVAGVNCLPEWGDAVIDLQGDPILPGFINAHDHLELNNFPRLKWRSRYPNVNEWISDFQPRFDTDPILSAAMSVPLENRLLLGGIKNLLSGATTVCHHNPLYRSLRKGFPARVIRRYRYSHSLQIDGEAAKKTYGKTPRSWPWIIHAAEGTDAAAAGEFALLDRWGCLGPNTIIVHGVGMGGEQQKTLIDRGGGLIWCPSSNAFLLGATADVRLLARARRVALGTDSRLSGERDLLAEMRYAAMHHHVMGEQLLRMVTVDAASLLRLSDAGTLRPGASADFVVLPQGSGGSLGSILAADRSQVRLVVLGGCAQVGDLDLLPAFEASGIHWVEVRVDGKAKALAKSLADKIRKSSIQEPGLEV
jgi:cytosine/adenosine deaminase-related metal-dependent hydrolase